MMRLQSNGTHFNKLLLICLLIAKGIPTDSLDDARLANSTLATTTESPIFQTKQATFEGTTPGATSISTKSTLFPSLPTSKAFVTKPPEMGMTIENDSTLHKDSEVTTSESPALKNYTGSTENPNISPPNELPAVRNAMKPNNSMSEISVNTKTRLLNTTESGTTSTTSIPVKPTTDMTEITTGHETEQTLHEFSATTMATEGLSTEVLESENVPESTSGSLEITTNLAEIATKFAEITTKIPLTPDHPVETTSLSESTTDLAESTTDLAESTTNLVESTTNLAQSTTNFGEATTNLAETTTNLAETTTNLAETTTLEEISTNLAETTSHTSKFIPNLVESTTNLAPEEVTTDPVTVAADSAEGTTSRSVSSTPYAISTGPPVSKNHVETNEIPSVVWFILILDGNCTHLARGRQGQRESGLKRQIIENLTSWLDTAKEDMTIPAGVVCTPEGRVHANLTLFLSGGATNITGKLKSLEDTKGPLFRFHGQEFYVYQILTADGFLNKEPDIPVDLQHTDVELLIYITVGSTCSFLFLLAMALLACKYCSCRELKPFEFGEPPNANMRLEDYTLTRIPRPKLGYVEYCRGLSKRYCPLDERTASSPSGMVQPFDTSVVPLEDARVQDFRDGVIVRPSDIRRLGGSVSRAYHTGCCGYRPASGYVTDADGYCVHSTENLHRAHQLDRYVDKGVDNPNFY